MASQLLFNKCQHHMQELFSNRVAQAVFSVRDDQPWMTASYSHQKLVPTSDFDIEDHLRFAECKQFIEDQEYNCKVTVERSTFDVEALLIQGLSPDTTQDALELHIEDMTGAEVKDVRYMNGKTEAIVKLNETIKFDSKILCTISDKDVKIVGMCTKRKVYGPRRRSVEEDTVPVPKHRYVEEDTVPVPTRRSVAKETVPVPTRRSVEKDTFPVPTQRPVEADMVPVPTRRPVEEDTVPVPTRRPVEVDMVLVPTRKPEDRPVEKDKDSVPIQGSEDLHKEKTDCATGSRAPVPRCPSPEESNVTELVRYQSVKQDLLSMLLPHLQSSLPNCSLKVVTEGIKLIGASRSVKQARLKISEQVFNFDSHSITNVPSKRAKLLLSNRGQQQVQELFSNAGIQAVLSVRDDQLRLTATDSHQMLVASRILEKNIRRFDIPVEGFHQAYLQSAECKQFIEDLEHNYTAAVEKGRSTLVIEALGDCTEEIQKQVLGKLEAHAQHTEEIHLEKEDWKLLKKNHEAEVEALGCKSADGTHTTQVTLTTLRNGKGVIQVSGHAKLFQDVKTAVKNLVGRIIHKTVKFSIPGLSRYMSEGEGAKAICGIQVTCNSLIRVAPGEGEEEDGEREEEPGTTSGAENNEENEMASKIALEVKQGDLTTFKVDVLVNTPASNIKDLTKCGKVCRVFCKAGGEQMQKLYDEAINDGDDVAVTQACGNLKCSHVFHMRIRALRTHNYQVLEDQIYRCLQKASELKANSIVFPTVGCGRLHYDPLEVVWCFKRAIKKHASDDICCVSKVIIAAYGEKTCREFEQLVSMTDSAQTSTGRLTPHNQTIAGRTSSSDGQLTTTFHITALGQAHIDLTMSQIRDSVKAYSAEETIQADHLAKFTDQEIVNIKSLGAEEVHISEDPQQKCFHLVGAKHAMYVVIRAVQQKVQETEGREEFIMRIEERSKYLNHTANRPVEIPGHWKSVKSLHEKTAVRMPVDPTVGKAIKHMVEKTWRQDVIGIGIDANNLTHKTIEVTNVEQIENPYLHLTYEHTRKAFCARAAKGSFQKITSAGEKNVLTSTLGISVLDEQLIPEINEHFLFHGAPQEVIRAILGQGVDHHLSKESLFGPGAYFCESATKADQYADKDKEKRAADPHYMFVFKVITGHSYIAKNSEWERKRPPCVPHRDELCSSCGKNEFFDSVMGTHRTKDDGVNTRRLLFREFVTYENSQSYPAYLITYNRK